MSCLLSHGKIVTMIKLCNGLFGSVSATIIPLPCSRCMSSKNPPESSSLFSAIAHPFSFMKEDINLVASEDFPWYLNFAAQPWVEASGRVPDEESTSVNSFGNLRSSNQSVGYGTGSEGKSTFSNGGGSVTVDGK